MAFDYHDGAVDFESRRLTPDHIRALLPLQRRPGCTTRPVACQRLFGSILFD